MLCFWYIVGSAKCSKIPLAPRVPSGAFQMKFPELSTFVAPVEFADPTAETGTPAKRCLLLDKLIRSYHKQPCRFILTAKIFASVSRQSANTRYKNVEAKIRKRQKVEKYILWQFVVPNSEQMVHCILLKFKQLSYYTICEF